MVARFREKRLPPIAALRQAMGNVGNDDAGRAGDAAIDNEPGDQAMRIMSPQFPRNSWPRDGEIRNVKREEIRTCRRNQAISTKWWICAASPPFRKWRHQHRASKFWLWSST
jgi:hypothetical protein